MARKIIIYNSFTHDANPHGTLLRRQLDEVNRDLMRCSTRDRKMLSNERRLLQRQIKAHDERTTTLRPGEAVASARDEGWHEGNMTGVTKSQAQYILKTLPKPRNDKERMVYEKLRAIASASQDGMGTPEEIAYAKGWQEYNTVNPYDDPKLAKEWERGRQDNKTARKFKRSGSRQGEAGTGMKRKVSFTEPKHKPGKVEPGYAAGGGTQYDYQSERGIVAKFVDKSGKVLARSEPFISEASARKWITDNTKAMVNRGHRGFTGSVEHLFYDPTRIAANDVWKRVHGGNRLFPNYKLAELEKALAEGRVREDSRELARQEIARRKEANES